VFVAIAHVTRAFAITFRQLFDVMRYAFGQSSWMTAAKTMNISRLTGDDNNQLKRA
jgi:hypothetical protein